MRRMTVLLIAAFCLTEPLMVLAQESLLPQTLPNGRQYRPSMDRSGNIVAYEEYPEGVDGADAVAYFASTGQAVDLSEQYRAAGAPPGDASDVVVSPDGNAVVFSWTTDNGISLVVRDLLNGGFRGVDIGPLVAGKFNSDSLVLYRPAFSPDGEALLFALDYDDDRNSTQTKLFGWVWRTGVPASFNIDFALTSNPTFATRGPSTGLFVQGFPTDSSDTLTVYELDPRTLSVARAESGLKFFDIDQDSGPAAANTLTAQILNSDVAAMYSFASLPATRLKGHYPAKALPAGVRVSFGGASPSHANLVGSIREVFVGADPETPFVAFSWSTIGDDASSKGQQRDDDAGRFAIFDPVTATLAATPSQLAYFGLFAGTPDGSLFAIETSPDRTGVSQRIRMLRRADLGLVCGAQQPCFAEDSTAAAPAAARVFSSGSSGGFAGERYPFALLSPKAGARYETQVRYVRSYKYNSRNRLVSEERTCRKWMAKRSRKTITVEHTYDEPYVLLDRPAYFCGDGRKDGNTGSDRYQVRYRWKVGQQSSSWSPWVTFTGYLEYNRI